MKKIFKIFLITILCTLISSCGGPSAEKVATITLKAEELRSLYDSTAPIVALLDDSSVLMYEKAGEIVRKSARAISGEFEGYSGEDLDNLIAKMDESMLVLKNLEGMEPESKEPDEKDGKIYPVTIVNDSGLEIASLLFQSGSGNKDIPIALLDTFSHTESMSASLQAPESEPFTIVATTYGDNKAIAFSGSFYIATVNKITLTNENGAYKILTSLKAE